MTNKENKDEYKKPELINIDDPAFDEKGQGSSVFVANCSMCKDVEACQTIKYPSCGTVGYCGTVTCGSVRCNTKV